LHAALFGNEMRVARLTKNRETVRYSVVATYINYLSAVAAQQQQQLLEYYMSVSQMKLQTLGDGIVVARLAGAAINGLTAGSKAHGCPFSGDAQYIRRSQTGWLFRQTI